jgi:ubiquinone/menaquinone biosynthesis C-methylase UbiE
VTGRRPSLGWQVARIAIAGSRSQAFLDHRWIGTLLRISPKRRRRSLALRILSLSPHYFIYQWERYPADWSRQRVLDAECERNVHSRRQIAEIILAPMIWSEATVLDFGCGPGFLAAQISALAGEVVGLDVSSGTLACAHVLNPGPTYRLNRAGRLPLQDETIDLVYSIAVFQHIDPAEWPAYFDDFARVLRPGARGVCHFAGDDRAPATYIEPRGLRARYSQRFAERRSDQITAALSAAGFVEILVEPIGARIDDDVGRQQLATFRKPG